MMSGRKYGGRACKWIMTAIAPDINVGDILDSFTSLAGGRGDSRGKR
jgi:hypothetical protein